MDIDLVSEEDDIPWKQKKCPWNLDESTNEYRCAIKNISICKYFRGIKPLDIVICAYDKK